MRARSRPFSMKSRNSCQVHSSCSLSATQVHTLRASSPGRAFSTQPPMKLSTESFGQAFGSAFSPDYFRQPPASAHAHAPAIACASAAAPFTPAPPATAPPPRPR